MKISGIKFYGLRYKLAQPLRFSLGAVTHRNFALVEVETDEDICGWGETFVNFPSWALEERKITLEKAITPLVVGRNPLDPVATTMYLESMLHRLATQWGAKGLIYQAIAAVDIAMWDIKGKVEGKPVYRLLGADKATPIPLYATGLEPSRLVEDALTRLREGYRAVKVRIGFDEHRDLEVVRSVCEAAHSVAGKVYVDVNQAWSQDQAMRLSREVSDAGVAWLEEPVPCDDVETMARIASLVRIPIAAGENYFTVAEFQRAVEAGALGVAMPDITRAGGFTGTTKIITAMQSRSIPCSLHHFGTDIGFIASLHLMTALQSKLEMLRDVSDCSLKWEVIGRQPRIENGQAWAPDGSGLGVEVDRDMVERYMHV